MSPIFKRDAVLAAALFLLLAAAAAAQDAAILWRGQTYPLGLSGSDFRVMDAARALGFDVTADPTTGVLTISGHGHRVLVGAGTAEVPVDQRIVSISRPAREIGGALYAPADFLEKVLFPLAGVAGTYDGARRVWNLSGGTSSLTIEAAVVHVDPTTQVVLKLSAAARFTPTASDTGFQVRWPGRTVAAPFSERRYDDPFVSAIRFSGETATIEFRQPGLTARAYPLTSPDRVVVEIGPPAATPGPAPTPVSSPAEPITIVIDPGHGGVETGAIGAGGLQEKDTTLKIARKLAAALPRALACRVVLTRDDDTLISLDDRTSVANHEKADLFLSIHANSSRAPGAHGSETYYLSLEASDKLAQEAASRENQTPAVTPSPGSTARHDLDFILWDLAQTAHLKESSELAEAIQNELNVVSGTENRGIKQAPFRVLVGATMPAVLVETAFISNPEEEKKLASPGFQQSVADAIAKAVANFFSRRRPSAVRITVSTPRPSPTATPSR